MLVPDTLFSGWFVPGGMRHGENRWLDLGETGAEPLDGNIGNAVLEVQRKVTTLALKDG